MKFFFIAIFLSISNIGFTQINLDSLFSIWNDTDKTDSVRLRSMYFIAWDGYLYTQPDSAFYYAQLQLDLALQLGDLDAQSSAYNTQGATYYIQGNLDSALIYYHKALDIDTQLGNKINMAAFMNNIANIYQDNGDFVKGMDYLMKCLHIYEEANDSAQIAATYLGIANIYFSQQNYDESVKFHQKAYNLYSLVGNKKDIAISLINLATSINNLGNDSLALEYYQQSITIFNELNNEDHLSDIYNNIGTIYFDKKEYSTALNYFLDAANLNIKHNSENQNSMILNNIGKIYYEQKLYKKAIDYSAQALQLAEKRNYIREINAASHALYQSYKKVKNTSKSLEMHELYKSTSDSMYNESIRSDIMRQRFQYDFDKQHLTDSITFENQHELDQIVHQTEMDKEINQRYALYGGLGIMFLIGGLLFRGYYQKKKDNTLIRLQKEEVELQKLIVEEKNKEITDSIAYAKRIQAAILPPNKIVKEYLNNSFIIYIPKDIVAGDFYWMEHKDNKTLFAVADCTGHGVPGAMVSVICNNGLNRSVREHGLTAPGKILDKTREIVIQEFEKSEEEVKDGMDIALCSLDGNTLQFAGANNPLWIIRKGEIIEIKPDKQPVGVFEKGSPFTTHTIELEKEDTFYIFSDGFVDQFGGERGKKFKSLQLKKMLLDLQTHPFENQKEALTKAFENWKGDLEQIDDVCFMGVKVT